MLALGYLITAKRNAQGIDPELLVLDILSSTGTVYKVPYTIEGYTIPNSVLSSNGTSYTPV